MANLRGQEQINIQVPFELVGPGRVEINNNGSIATFEGITIFSVEPAIFEVSVDGVRIAAALRTSPSYRRKSPLCRTRLFFCF